MSKEELLQKHNEAAADYARVERELKTVGDAMDAARQARQFAEFDKLQTQRDQIGQRLYTAMSARKDAEIALDRLNHRVVGW